MKSPRIPGFNRLARLWWETKFYWTPRRWTMPLSDIVIDRPVFLLGTQSGGLTILSRILRRHSSAVSCSGNADWWAGRDELQNVRYLNLPSAFRLGRLADRYKMFGKNRLPDHPEFGPVRNFTYACDELVGFYRKTEQDYTPEIQQGLEKTIKQCIRAYARDVWQCRFIDKSQSYTLKIPLLRRCLSRPKFILVARNPFALCARYRQPQGTDAQWRRPPGIERKWEVAIQHWKNTFSIALEDLKGQTDGLVVRFEDFLAAPEPTVRKIAGFLELPWEEGLLPSAEDRLPAGSVGTEKWYPLQTDVNRKYVEQLDGPAKQRIKEQLGQIASALGYE